MLYVFTFVSFEKRIDVCMSVLDFDSILCVIFFPAPAGWLGSSEPCRVTLCRAGPPTDS